MKGYRYHDPESNEWFTGDFLKYKECQKKMKKLGITSMNKLREFKEHSPLKVLDIPRSPQCVYRKQWKTYYDFFGNYKPSYIELEQAKKIMKKLGIKTEKEFHKLKDENHKLLKNIPRRPNMVYCNGKLAHPIKNGEKK